MIQKLKKILVVVSSALAVTVVALAQNEVKTTVKLEVNKDQLKYSLSPDRVSSDMTGNNMCDFTQTFTPGVSNMIAVSSSVKTNGMCLFQALWTNKLNSVDIGSADSTTNIFRTIRIQAGESHLVRLHPTNAIAGTAVAGTNTLRIVVVEK